MSKIFRRKIRTEKGHSKEYDGLLYIRNRVLRCESGEIQSAAGRRKGAIDGRLSAAREWAGRVLRKAGLPDTLRTVQMHRDCTWTELPSDSLKDVDDIPDGESIPVTNVLTMVYAQEPATDMPSGWESWTFEEIAEHVESLPAPPVDVPAATNKRELSLEWFACQLLERAESLEAALAAGDTQWAALAGIELSDAWHHAILSERFEIPIVVGLAQIGYGRDGKSPGRPGVSKSELADIQRQADAIWRLNPTWAKTEIAEAIENKHGLTADTVRRKIRKPVEAPKK
ncbi:MAG: hypothetical protein H5U26_12590 [Immundisolibacter sp.]|uniref:hypothetical protein n=1 Tax=Immundisolibacter sp. TaxID=1934948 RepID=UPI0019C97738|nr:hypothetical protein [Immundisolibacter sp.]MBC7162928.1 hypothetical protein [Immundisolibacter sp.]